MLRLLLFSSVLLMTLSALKAQQLPTVQDLDFLVGKWEIQFAFYDTHKPNTEPIFTEKGVRTCFYEMKYRGVPMFITCEGQLVINSTDDDHTKGMGRTREFRETIRYSRFENSFERIGLYSNWPATGLETLFYDSTKRQFIIRGQLNVQNNMLERYVDTFQFNENYTYAERTNIANFSDMPIAEYNLTFKGTYKKINDN